MMRGLAFAALVVGITAAAPISASAATIQVPVTFILNGDTNQIFSADFLGFDPKLGTLTSASITVSGTVTWMPGQTSGHDQSATLLMTLTPIVASQTVNSPNRDEQDIDVELNGASAGIAIGSGTQTELLTVTDTSDGTFGRKALEGTVTYTFTAATPAAPEPSTWAMLLMGFAGLGYAAVMRRRVLR